MRAFAATVFAVTVLSGSLCRPAASLAAPTQELKEVQNLFSPELKSVTSVAVTKDGKFAYAAAFSAGTVCTFKRDPATGRLEITDAIADSMLQSVVGLSFSKDERYVAACAFSANALTLFSRDPKTGTLSFVDSADESARASRGLNFVIAASFSPKSDFLYTGCKEGLGVYEFKGDKLKFVQFTDGDGKLSGVRGVTLSPNGEWIYATAMTSGTLGIFKRDTSNGFVLRSRCSRTRRVVRNHWTGLSARW